jgi:DNA invertase Pin-like site-specific DNA recombinase
VIVAKRDRLTRSVRDLSSLIELFEKRNVALISVAESLDTSTTAERLVLTIMGAVSQWERQAIGERTREALRHKRGKDERVGNLEFGYREAADGRRVEPNPAEQAAVAAIRTLHAKVPRCGVSPQPRTAKAICTSQVNSVTLPWHTSLGKLSRPSSKATISSTPSQH